MKRTFALIMLLVITTILLSSCANNNTVQYEEVPQPTQYVPLGNPQPAAQRDEPAYDDYDPAGEEDTIEVGGSIPVPQQVYDPLRITEAPTVRGAYAGATPVLIDPIDKPTPTPVPPLDFTYQVYDATKLHLSFEAPAGWVVDDSAGDTFVMMNPSSQFDYAATMTVRVIGVASNYSSADLKKEVKQMMDTLKTGFASFSPSSTANRNLLDKAGVYANFKATTRDDKQVAGRVHVTCIDKKLYSVMLSYPQAYTSTYVDKVYDKFRHTLKITQ